MSYSIKTLKRAILLIMLLSPVLSIRAQITTPDTICAGEIDVVYGVSNPTSGSIFSWSLSDPTAGTINNSISGNDSIIHIDWGSISGNYTLSVIETGSKGCVGDTISIAIYVKDYPTISLEGDSVCNSDQATMTWHLTGQSPWVVDYSDGTNTYSETVVSSPHTLLMPIYSSTTTISITGISDGSSSVCSVSSSLPSTDIYIYPKPSTGSIFHY